MFLSHSLRMERKDAMSSWHAEQTQFGQWFFFPSWDGSHAGSWAAAGSLLSFLLFYPQKNCLATVTAPCMLGSLGKCNSFKYDDSLSKEQHLQDYLMRAKGQGTMCRENYHYPGCSEQGDCAPEWPSETHGWGTGGRTFLTYRLSHSRPLGGDR